MVFFHPVHPAILSPAPVALSPVNAGPPGKAIPHNGRQSTARAAIARMKNKKSGCASRPLVSRAGADDSAVRFLDRKITDRKIFLSVIFLSNCRASPLPSFFASPVFPSSPHPLRLSLVRDRRRKVESDGTRRVACYFSPLSKNSFWTGLAGFTGWFFSSCSSCNPGGGVVSGGVVSGDDPLHVSTLHSSPLTPHCLLPRSPSRRCSR